MIHNTNMIHNNYFKCCVNCVKKMQSIAVLKLVGDMRTVATVFQRINLHSKIYTRKTVHIIGLKRERLFHFKAI
jgi:hypothetical protein